VVHAVTSVMGHVRRNVAMGVINKTSHLGGVYVPAWPWLALVDGQYFVHACSNRLDCHSIQTVIRSHRHLHRCKLAGHIVEAGLAAEQPQGRWTIIRCKDVPTRRALCAPVASQALVVTSAPCLPVFHITNDTLSLQRPAL
jgi:hypothetical protein